MEQETSTRLDKVEQHIFTLVEKHEHLEDRVDRVEDLVKSLNADIEDLQQHIRAGFTSIHSKIDGVTNRAFDSVSWKAVSAFLAFGALIVGIMTHIH